MELKEGQIVNARVSGMQPYGAFVEMEDGKSGLVYCREPDDADSADCHRSAANVLPAAVHGFSHRLVGGDSGESCCLQKVCAFGAAETGIFGRCSKW